LFKNYFTIAIRNLLRNKVYTLINMVGLGIGMAAAILIGLYVHNEFQVDRHHQYADRIYRVIRATQANTGDTQTYVLNNPGMLGPDAASTLPEVETATRIWSNGVLMTYGDKKFNRWGYLTDNHIFDVLTLPLIQGDPKTALTNPGSIVLTESTAQQIFGQEDPLGKAIQLASINLAGLYTVTGVIKDFPQQSTLYAEFLLSLQNDAWIRPGWETWQPVGLGYHAETYLKLRTDANMPALIQKLNALAQTRLNEKDRQTNTFHLQPLLRAHLHSTTDYKLRSNGSIDQVISLIAIGVFILLIACINFVNLSTASATLRAREVGLRKVVGAYREQLFGQFLSESLIQAALSLLLGCFLAFLALPTFNGFVERDLTFGVFQNLYVLLMLPVLWLLVSLMAGSYPAFVLSAFRPVETLKGIKNMGHSGVWLRKGLVMFQFAMSILLIICTVVVHNQLTYIQNKDMGFNREQVVTLPIFSRHWNTHGGAPEDRLSWDVGPVKRAFSDHPNVEKVASYRFSIGRDKSTGGGPIKRNFRLADGHEMRWFVQEVDEGFLSLLDIDLIAGRNFSADLSSDRTEAVILNETAVRQLGWKNPLGQTIEFLGEDGQTCTVIGVVKDFHLHSLHGNIEPVLIYMSPGFYRHIALKVKMDNFSETLAHFERVWNRYLPEREFEFSFLEDRMMTAYRALMRLERTFNAFAMLAVLVACLGLFGLAAFTAERRTKEIGIRKVLGASEPNIVGLLSRDFASLVLLANIIAWPLAYWIMNNWLQNFTYRLTLNVWPFALSGFLALLIATITVGYHALKAARANPVDAVRYE
jgi:putative ABC transport system permease protein